jgi:outer membrane protein TolC
MKRILFIAVYLIFHQALGQELDTISLGLCQEQALKNYPLIRQREMMDASLVLKQKNLKASYYPQLNVNGQASYQSEVTKVIMNIPLNPFFNAEDIAPTPISKDWYKLSLDVSQIIWDGGTTSRQEELEQLNSNLDKQGIEIDLYQLKVRINAIYFNIILLQENGEIVRLAKEDLESKLKQVESAVKNGVLLETEADNLRAEVIKTDQQLVEIRAGIQSGLAMMRDLTGFDLSNHTLLLLPEPSVDPSVYGIFRPEYTLLSMQQERLTAMEEVVSTKIRPRVFGFGQAGIGRPGLNMLSNSFDPFYIIGAKLSWNVWDWSQTRHEKQLLGIQHDIIGTQKETFEMNLNVTLETYRGDIRKYEELLKQDDAIINLRANITKKASSQLNNGVITSADFLTYFNGELQAKLNKEIHKVNLIKARIDYLSAQGMF